MLKKICVVTGSRAEYGLLYWLMRAIKAESCFQLQIIATGMHLSHEFGLTYKKILEDGFIIDEQVEMLLSSDTSVGITKSIGLGVIGFADAYARLKPDMVVVLGDRFETLAAVQAAFIANIPVTHLHGGELTLGAYDDGIRHSITKMSHLHFVATNEYRQRVIQLGEQPNRVFHVGAMVVDSIHNTNLLTQPALEKILGITFEKLKFAITFHPETLSNYTTQDQFAVLLKALACIKDTTFIFTKANADTNGRIINDMIDDFCKNRSSAKGFVSLGHQNYLSLLNIVDIAIGNSSSGIIEAPYFNIPTVNIGDRQKGRIRPLSVIDCAVDQDAILVAIQEALSESFKNKMCNMNLPYGQGKVTECIMDVLKKTDFSTLIKKDFYDI